MTTLAEALAPKSDQLNADDLIPGPRTLKITGARISSEDRQKRVVLNYEGDQGKPFKPCKTMGRAMVMVWGVTDESQMIGKSIRVYRDPEVKFGDQGAIGGVRISHMSHIDKPANVKLTVSQGKKALFTFHPLVTDAAPTDEVSNYVRDLIARIEACAEAADVMAIATEQETMKRRAWLAKNRMELAKAVDAAIVATLDRLSGNDPAEKRADTDMGDGFTDDGGEADRG